MASGNPTIDGNTPVKNSNIQELSLEKMVRKVLQAETARNAYGTTLAFIQGRVKCEEPTKIKDILDSASWAKFQFGRYTYVNIEMPTTEKQSSVASAKTASITYNTPVSTIDFNGSFELAYTKPESFSYFGEVMSCGNSWTELYVNFVSTMLEDYPHIFSVGMSFSKNNGRIEFAAKTDSDFMLAPKQIPGTEFVLETNISARGIASKMKYIMELCNVDFENVVITYRKKSKEPSSMPSKEVATLETNEVDALLCDEIFAPLRLALKKEKIRTVDGLKKLKLWVFMNQNNLYSISARQSVLTKVRLLLEPSTAQNASLLYTIHCGTAVYSGDTLTKAFLHFCEDIAVKHPLFFRTLIDKKIGSTSRVLIYRSPENDGFLKMENPSCYISADITRDVVLTAVQWMCDSCKDENLSVSIKEPNDVQSEPIVVTSSQEESISSLAQIDKAEALTLTADMNGITYDELYSALNIPMSAVKALIRECKHVIEIKGRLYHEDAFIDWEDGVNELCTILDKLMQKNNGYISAVQLYDYARVEMNMFLNDNDLNDERSVYEIAQHLFEKNSFNDRHYAFIGKAHISKIDSTIASNFDIICKFAGEQGGVFSQSDLEEYLVGIGIKTGNLRNQMHLNRRPDFFFYEPGILIWAKSMSIDEAWKDGVRRCLQNLFRDADGHIILRQIQSVWFDSLPTLPGGRTWTPLLLQFVLRFFGEELGAKTIAAMEYQSMDTLHAMLVTSDSPIQNFGDAVIACLIENEIEQRSFEAEELRQLLGKVGMIQGNELIWNMPKALAKDERFAWDVEGENVTVRM